VGLAERTADPSDRRALFVKLTPDGEQRLAAIMTRFAEIYETRLGGVDRLPGGRDALELGLRTLMADFAAP
jgi:DNA-binding MarR family transcriptional regulator